MAYGVAKRFSKDGEKFGTGQVEGVVAPETAAHAAGTSALLPMLTLGVPGSPTAAVLLGGLLIWGLQPGPLLFQEQKEFVWGLIASMYLGNIAGLIVVLTCVPLFAAILRIPFSIIAPMIIVICAIGAYTVHNSMFDVYLMVVFGVAGYVLRKLDYPLAPLVLALVLGDRAESAFRQAMLVSQGDMSIFFSKPLVGGMTSARAGAALLAAHPGRAAQGEERPEMTVVAMTMELGVRGNEVAAGVAEALGLAVVSNELAERLAGRAQRQEEPRAAAPRGQGLAARAPLGAGRGARALHCRGGVRRCAAGRRAHTGLGLDPAAAPGAAHRMHPGVRAGGRADQDAARRAWTPTTTTYVREEIEASDEAHAAAMQARFRVKWGDPLLYDLTLNTGARLDRILRRAGRGAHRAGPSSRRPPASRATLANLALEARVRAALACHARDGARRCHRGGGRYAGDPARDGRGRCRSAKPQPRPRQSSRTCPRS